MHYGKVTKNFIVCGKHSETALLNTEKNWKHGYFETVYVDSNDQFNQLDRKKLEQSDHDINIIIIDNDICAIKKTIEFFRILNTSDVQFDITAIVIVDIANKVFDNALNQLHEKLKGITLADVMHVNHCRPAKIESLISMYNHLQCGFSFIPTEFEDLHEVLSSGYYFEASEVAVSTVDELPFAISKALYNILLITGELVDFKDFVLIIISDNKLSLGALEACSTRLRKHVSSNFIVSTNMNEKNKYAIQIGAVFNK